MSIILAVQQMYMGNYLNKYVSTLTPIININTYAKKKISVAMVTVTIVIYTTLGVYFLLVW